MTDTSIRQLAQGIVEDHGSTGCDGIGNPERPYCYCLPLGAELCPKCEALRDDIESALTTLAAQIREEDARIADAFANEWLSSPAKMYEEGAAAETIAAAIRAKAASI